MPKLAMLAIAGAAAIAATGAHAAKGDKHVMDVPVPGGSTVHIEYYGDVAPTVTVAPRPFAGIGAWPLAADPFPRIDAMIERMNRATRMMREQIRQAQSRAASGLPPANVVSYGTAPAGANSVSIVTVSNGRGTCTRTTEVTSQGPGKPPRVVSKVSGTCAPASNGTPQAAAGSGPVSRT
jgi:hypothetical protein